MSGRHPHGAKGGGWEVGRVRQGGRGRRPQRHRHPHVHAAGHRRAGQCAAAGCGGLCRHRLPPVQERREGAARHSHSQDRLRGQVN